VSQPSRTDFFGVSAPSSFPPWRVILAAWTAWGLLWAAEVSVSSRMGGRSIPFGTALMLQIPLAFLWALLTPGIIWLGRRMPPFGTPRWRRGVAVNLLSSMLVVFGTGVFFIANNRRIQGTPAEAPPLLLASVRSFVYWFSSDGLLYWAILAIDFGVRDYRESRERELRASQLEGQLSEARLQALKMQLHPHFLFNALHTIGQLIRTGQDARAIRVVAGLGDLLRRLLDSAATQEVPLKQELEFLRSYVDIEQARFTDRLNLVVTADPDTLDAQVPHLILQPLVENAIRHGIAPRVTAGRLLIGARRINGTLHLIVRDDGTGIPTQPGERESQGLGLANTSARLLQLYGPEASFEVVNVADGGVEAHIVVPYRLAAAEWQGGGDT
jgi:two-component system LytT family sensor kinase